MCQVAAVYTTFKNASKPICVQSMRVGRKKPREQSEDKIIKTIKDRIIKDNKKFFEQGEDYYKPLRLTIKINH